MKRYIFAVVIGFCALLAFSAVARDAGAANLPAADPSTGLCADDSWQNSDSDDTALPVADWIPSPQQRHVYTRPAVAVFAGFHSIERPQVRGPPAYLPMS